MSQNTDDFVRGILTKTDREYLQGETEYDNPQTDAHRRRDIRDRVSNAFRDFELLIQELDESEREKIFSEPVIKGSIVHLIGFLCLGLERERLEDFPNTKYQAQLRFRELEEVTRWGVMAALWYTEFEAVSASAEISASGYSAEKVESLKNAIANGTLDSLEPQQAKILTELHEIDTDNLLKFLESELQSEEE